MDARRHLARLAVVLTATLVVVGVCTACAVSPGGAAGAVAAQTDWQHALQVVANVKASPPAQPVVYLLGGSVARECVVSEASWAAQVVKKGGPATLTYDLGSQNRTTGQDLKLVAELPQTTQPTIVLIGVNVGRFTQAPTDPTITLPDATDPLPAWDQHHYSKSQILTLAKKRQLVSRWMTRRYPLFKTNFKAGVAQLEALVKACRDKGFHPILFELPRNTAVIGHAMDKPVSRYRASCKALATEYKIPWVSLQSSPDLKLVNGDFYDLWHLVEPGRVKWQALLSAKTVKWLAKYSAYGSGQ